MINKRQPDELTQLTRFQREKLKALPQAVLIEALSEAYERGLYGIYHEIENELNERHFAIVNKGVI